MADTKITSLLTPQVTTNPATDVLPIVNIADTSMASSGSTRKITVNTLLGSGGTATLASATITGALTVDTTTLVVNPSGYADRVGIGTATPATRFVVSGGRTGLFSADAFSLALGQTTGQANYLYLGTDASGTLLVSESSGNSVMTLSQSGVCNWLDGAGGTQMTLNSTGLGVGVSPSYKLDVQGADNSIIAQFGGTSRKINFTTSANGAFANGFFNFVSTSSVGAFSFQNTSGTLLTIDNGGNVGIAVTPVNKLTIGTGTFNASTVSGSSSLYSTVAQGLVILADGLAVATRGGVNKLIANSAGDIISSVTGTAPSLTDNGYMVFNLTSNTNLRISVRGTDGTTRTANITLA